MTLKEYWKLKASVLIHVGIYGAVSDAWNTQQERIDKLEAKCKAYNNLLDNQKLSIHPGQGQGDD